MWTLRLVVASTGEMAKPCGIEWEREESEKWVEVLVGTCDSSQIGSTFF